MNGQPRRTVEDLWALVEEQQTAMQRQRAEIDQLKARGQGRRWGRSVTRCVSLALSLTLVVVLGGIAYAGVPAMRAGAAPPAQTGWYVRWNGTRWVSSMIQPTDVPPLPLAGDLSGDQYGATVTGLQGLPLASGTPADGQVLEYSSADGKWEPGFYRRTAVVSPVLNSDGSINPTSSGSALTNALNNITTASATNPYLLHLEPGIYDVGGTPLQMKSYVDIEGSGQTTTTIRGSGQPVGGLGVVAIPGSTTAELRNLTVQNVGGNKYGNAVFASSGSVVTLRDVTISSSGELACTNCGGIGFSNGGTARLVNSIITMSVPSGDSADAVANTGTITIFGSELHGAPFAIYNGFSGTPPARVIDSQVDGTLGGSGPPTCVGAYNASYAAVGASCS